MSIKKLETDAEKEQWFREHWAINFELISALAELAQAPHFETLSRMEKMLTNSMIRQGAMIDWLWEKYQEAHRGN